MGVQNRHESGRVWERTLVKQTTFTKARKKETNTNLITASAHTVITQWRVTPIPRVRTSKLSMMAITYFTLTASRQFYLQCLFYMPVFVSSYPLDMAGSIVAYHSCMVPITRWVGAIVRPLSVPMHTARGACMCRISGTEKCIEHNYPMRLRARQRGRHVKAISKYYHSMALINWFTDTQSNSSKPSCK